MFCELCLNKAIKNYFRTLEQARWNTARKDEANCIMLQLYLFFN